MREPLNPPERRKQPRVKIALGGRYLLADGREHRCTVIDASPTSVALAALERGEIGEPAVVYVETVGRLEGRVRRIFPGGCVVQFDTPSRAAEALTELVQHVTEKKRQPP